VTFSFQKACKTRIKIFKPGDFFAIRRVFLFGRGASVGKQRIQSRSRLNYWICFEKKCGFEWFEWFEFQRHPAADKESNVKVLRAGNHEGRTPHLL
jgi:hypothetical protein